MDGMTVMVGDVCGSRWWWIILKRKGPCDVGGREYIQRIWKDCKGHQHKTKKSNGGGLCLNQGRGSRFIGKCLRDGGVIAHRRMAKIHFTPHVEKFHLRFWVLRTLVQSAHFNRHLGPCRRSAPFNFVWLIKSVWIKIYSLSLVTIKIRKNLTQTHGMLDLLPSQSWESLIAFMTELIHF